MLDARLQHLVGEYLAQNQEGVSDSYIAQLFDALEEQELAATHLARLRSAVVDSGAEGRGVTPVGLQDSDAQAMKLARQHILITADEHRCSPGEAAVFAGGCVRIAVRSGPPQSFEIANAATGESDDTPRIPAGQEYEWRPAVPGTHTIASHIYPGCKAQILVQPAPSGRPDPQQQQPSSMSQVDEHIRFPLRSSRAAQTDPQPASTSRFAATDLRLPPLGPSQAAWAPASVLPDVTSAAAAAMNSSLFASPEEEELGSGGLFGQTGLRRRASSTASSQRPGSAGSGGSLGAQSVGPRASTPDIGSSGSGRATPAAGGLSAEGSQELRGPSPRASSAGPIFKPVRNMGVLQRSLSPVAHSAEETVPLLDIRMNSRVQQRPSPVFTSSSSRGALVSPTAVASRDATHKCPRCRKEFLSLINQRRCLAVHLGHKAGGGKGTKAGALPDRSQLVEFWDSLSLEEKQAILNLQGEAGSEAVLSSMARRVQERDSGALTTEQRAMLAAGRTLFDVLNGKGLESVSGEALATLLAKTSEGTFLYDRSLPARDEAAGGYNTEAALGSYVGRRLADALLMHRQQQAEKAQRELEELEEAQKGEKSKQADKKKKEKGKAKPKASKQKPGGSRVAGKAPSAGGTSLSRTSSATSLGGSDEQEGYEEPGQLGAPAVEDSARVNSRQPSEQPTAAAAAVPAAAAAAAATPARPATGQQQSSSDDNDLTPPPTNPRYTPVPEPGRPSARHAITYSNALYRMEEEEGPCGWQPAGRANNRAIGGQQGVGGAARPAAGGAGRPGGGVLRSNVFLAEGHAIPRPTQQQQQAQQISDAGHRAGQRLAPVAERFPEAVPSTWPGAKGAPSISAGAGRSSRGEVAPAPAKQGEAFPALPTKADSKGAAQPGMLPAGFSYAAAARPKAQLAPAQAQQQSAAHVREGGPAKAAAAPQHQQQQPQEHLPDVDNALPAAAAKPLPVLPATRPPPTAAASSQLAPAAEAAASERAGAVTAAAPAAGATQEARSTSPAPAAAPEQTLVASVPQPAVAVQQLLAVGSGGSSEDGGEGSSELAQAAQQVLELQGSKSTTPPLLEEGEEGTAVGQPSRPVMPQEAPFAASAPYGYPAPPMGLFFYPMRPAPSVQFGDVDLGEILQQEHQERQHQQQCFFPAFPPPMPYGAAPPPGMPLPFPPPAPLPAQPLPQPARAQASGPVVQFVEPQAQHAGAPLAARANAALVQQAGAAAEPAAAARPERSGEAGHGLGRQEGADNATDGNEAPIVGELERPSQQAGTAREPPAALQAAAAADASSRHLASMLRAAANAACQPPAFDAAAAAQELAARWQAASAGTASVLPEGAKQGIQPQQQPQQQQQQQGMSRSSSGSGSGGGSSGSWGQPSSRHGTPKSEWRPALREQTQPAQALGHAPRRGTWVAKQEPGGGGAPAGAQQPSTGAMQRPLSFAAVAGGSAKANGHAAHVHASTVQRTSSSNEAGAMGEWKIQAAK